MGDGSATTRVHGYEVRVRPLARVDSLAVEWRALEARSSCSFFLSWAWIGTWLQLVCATAGTRVVSVHCDGRTVGLGIVTARRRFHGLGPRHLRLHEVGRRALDNLTIEYNGLLAEHGHEKAAITAAITHLARVDPSWLTFHVAGICAEHVDAKGLEAAALGVRAPLRASHFVDLGGLRRCGGGYLAALGPSTRATIRRTTRRLCASFGEVRLDVADSTERRHGFFRELVALHQRHWLAKDGTGAFTDPRVVRFHEQLIGAADGEQGAQFIRLRAGDAVVGYVYQLAWRGRMYYYQAGIDYTRFGEFGSPGLLLLARAVEQAAEQRCERYEFMAGDTRYKRSLGTHQDAMAWLYVDRIGWMSKLRQVFWSLQGSHPQ